MMANTVELTDGGTVRSPDGRSGEGRSQESPLPDPMIGRVLLHYRVGPRIGSGGMSVVYRGRDERLGREVAIKVLHPFLAEKAECRARLAREARAVARLEHENILRIFDFSGDPITVDERPGGSEADAGGAPEANGSGTQSDEGFLVTELVVGGTLKRFADEHRLWEQPEAGALVVWQLARALQHAHDQGVVHRDIKPENVMVRDDGVLKLMDFGIAQVADSTSLTVTGTLLGSPAHMAPECIEGFHADARSDLFSLGTVLYWLMCGALPFEAVSPHALLKAIVDGRYPPPQQKQPRVSNELARVVKRAMALRPDDRYQTAGQLADAIADALVIAGVDPSTRSVIDTLADPGTSLGALSSVVRTATLARAARLLDEGAPTRALQALGRVLAEHPQDPAARALLDRAQSAGYDDDTTDDEAAAGDGASVDGAREADRSLPPKDTDPDAVTAVTATHGAVAEAAASAALSGGVRGRKGLLPWGGGDDAEPASLVLTLQRAALVVGAGALIAVAAAVATNLDRLTAAGETGSGQAAGTSTPPPPSKGAAGGAGDVSPPLRPGPAPDVAPPRGPTTSTGNDAPTPGSPEPRRPALDRGDGDGSAKKPLKARGPDRGAAGASGSGTGQSPEASKGDSTAESSAESSPDELVVDDKAGPAAASPMRMMLIKANSYGTVRIGGGDTAQLTPLRVNEVPVPVGEHKLTFVAIAALPIEQTITVAPDGEPPKLDIQFEPRPALLVVRTDTPEAYIAIRPLLDDDSGKETIVGQAADSERRPFVLRFPPHPTGRMVGKLTFEVTATHGDRIVARRVDVRAGQSKSLRIDLKPEAAPPAPLPPAPSP